MSLTMLASASPMASGMWQDRISRLIANDMLLKTICMKEDIPGNHNSKCIPILKECLCVGVLDCGKTVLRRATKFHMKIL